MGTATMTTNNITRRSVGISFATQYVDLAIQFSAVMVLARILSPNEIGTFSVAAFLMTMLHVFRDFGVAQYVIQERDLTSEKLQAAIGVGIVLALTVALLMYAISGPVATFYGNPAIKQVMVVMAASFAISPFGSILLGLLRRQNKLVAIFFVKIVSAVSQVSVAVALALHGYGAVSLAWGNFAGILAFGIAANFARPSGTPWKPRFNNMREILSFGSFSSLGNLSTIAGTSAPELVIGKVMNLAAVGYFSRATGLVQLFTRLIAGALTPLVLPYFSQMRREGQDLTKPYLLAVEQMTALAWPFFAALLCLAYPMTRALYGPQWDVSVPVVRLLCIGSAISSITLFATQAMIANGQIRSSTLCNLCSQPLRILAVLVCSMYGLLAVAVALLASECFSLVVVSWFLHKTIRVGPASVLAACRKSLVITVCSAIGPALVWSVWGDDPLNAWTPLLIGIASAAMGWFASLILTRHPLAEHLLSMLGAAPPSGPVSGKDQVKRLAYHGGVLGLFHRWRNRRTLTVTMFHRVLPADDPRHAGADPEWTMTPDSLDRCLRFFKRHYQVVTAEQVFAALRGEQALPPRSMLVTFDDGWADTAEFAQPVLDRNGISALVFVAAGAVNRAAPFWEELLYSFLATQPASLSRLKEEMAASGLAPLDPVPAQVNEHAIRAVIRQLGQCERTSVLAMVARLPDPGAAFPAMLDAEQLSGLSAGGHAIGGHGMTHQPLTRVEDLEQEMREAQSAIVNYLRHGPIESMSLPHGASSPKVLDQCRAAGYRYLFNSESYLNAVDHRAAVGGLIGTIGRIHIPQREITGHGGQVDPVRLATWLMLRPIKPVQQGREQVHG
jgi:O-antigen/teichoic acid export membrane protein/peptidoglycan/xylan/chitin deacetylase (PgdA/CDA1 family)